MAGTHCRSCGAAIAPSQRFCAACGAAQPSSAAAVAPAVAAPAPTAPTTGPGFLERFRLEILLGLVYGGAQALANPGAPVVAFAVSAAIGFGVAVVGLFLLRRLKGLLIALLILVFVLGGAGALAVAGLRSGVITERQILTLIGRGPAEIQLSNLRDDEVTFGIAQLDVQADRSPIERSVRLRSFELATFEASEPGRYDVTVSLSRGGTSLGRCTLRVGSGDHFDLVPMPDGKIIVSRAGQRPNTPSDVVVATSPLCR